MRESNAHLLLLNMLFVALLCFFVRVFMAFCGLGFGQLLHVLAQDGFSFCGV